MSVSCLQQPCLCPGNPVHEEFSDADDEKMSYDDSQTSGMGHASAAGEVS